VAAHLRGDGAKRGMVVPASRFRRGVLALADEVVERDRNARLGANMITLEDCVGLCGLTEEEVLAIAEHEHLSEIAATALAAYLLSQEHGGEKVLDMIVDDIRQAQLVKGKARVGLATCPAPFLENASRGQTISASLEQAVLTSRYRGR
jgi:hypothetical protein